MKKIAAYREISLSLLIVAAKPSCQTWKSKYNPIKDVTPDEYNVKYHEWSGNFIMRSV